MLGKQGYMHARACTHPRAWAHKRATQLCNIYCFSSATMNRQRASLLRYTSVLLLQSHSFSNQFKVDTL
jgi:hypothetical protein